MKREVVMKRVCTFLSCWICVTCVTPKPDVQPTGAERVRVQVSRREMRVTFPPDTAHSWGWIPRDWDRFYRSYLWGVGIFDEKGSWNVGVSIGRPKDSTALTFSSLRDLVAAQAPHVCGGEDDYGPTPMILCYDDKATASVEGGRVTLVLRDSAMIEGFFRVRPTYVNSFHETPYDTAQRTRFDTTRVEYIAPQIPAAEPALERRRREANENWSQRELHVAGREEFGAIWLTVGDTASLLMTKSRCSANVCRERRESMPAKGWSVDESTVAELRAHAVGDAEARVGFPGSPPFYLRAMQPGRTIVRLRGLPRDTLDLLLGRKQERELQRVVFVTRPIVRVALMPRRDTVRVGEKLEFRLRAIDVTQEVIEFAPSRVTLDDGETIQHHAGPEQLRVTFQKPGVRTLIGRLGVHADTLRLTVLPAIKR